MNITKADLIKHASRFDFYSDSCLADLVRVERIRTRGKDDYWVIRWGGSRWSKKEKMFIMEPARPLPEDYIEDTRFTLEEAYTLAGSKNLVREHEKKLKELHFI